MVDEASKREAVQWMQMGIVSLKNKDVEQARQCLLKACSLDPDNVDVLLWLTNTSSDPRERRRILQRVLALQPDHPQAARALAQIETQLSAEPRKGSGLLPRKASGRLPEALPPAEPAAEPPAPPASAALPSPTEGGLLARLAGAAAAAPEPARDGPRSVFDAAPLEAAPEPALDDLRSMLDVEVDLAAVPEAPVPATIEPSPIPELDALPLPAADDMVPLPPVSLEAVEIEEDVQRLRQAQEADTDLGRCPRCGAVLRPHARTRVPYCVFCGYSAAAADESGPAARVRPEQPWPQAREARRCLICDAISLPSSGGSVEAGCPLCRQVMLDAAPSALALPDLYVPFAVSEAEAAIAIEDEAGGGRGRKRPDMTRPRALFLPVWLFNGQGRAVYDAGGSAGGQSTETYSLVPVHGVPQIDGRLLRLASALDLERAPHYRPDAGSQGAILLPNLTLTAAAAEARGLMLQDVRQKAEARIKPSGTGILARRAAGNLSVASADVTEVAYQLALLPVWVNEVRDGGRIRLGLVNGSTGKAALGEPVKRRRMTP